MLSLPRPLGIDFARKLPVDGSGLYQASEVSLLEIYGIPGKVLYNDVQDAKSGRVCFHSPHLTDLTNKHSSVF